MKYLIVASIFLPAFTGGFNIHPDCNNIRPGIFANNTGMKDSATIAGTWQLMPVLASDTAAGKIPKLNFDLKTNRFSGNTGCNAMNGSFVIKEDALRFGENMVSTKMACAGYNEKAFIENLLKTNRYEIKNGVLQLMYNTTILSNWVRHSDTSITKQI